MKPNTTAYWPLIVLLIVIHFTFIPLLSPAQDSAAAKYNIDRVSLGVGVGIDYGGIGGNLLLYPLQDVGIFGGAGYAFIGIGYNVGLKLRLAPGDRAPKVVPYLLAMYGYNTAVKVSSSNQNGFGSDFGQYNKFFYGPSFGIGLDLYPQHNKAGYWTVDLIVPVRGADVNNYINNLETTDDVSFKNKPFPVLLSVAYRFMK
jgi:hypothetical protein